MLKGQIINTWRLFLKSGVIRMFIVQNIWELKQRMITNAGTFLVIRFHGLQQPQFNVIQATDFVEYH